MKLQTKQKVALDPAPVNPATGQLYYDRTVLSLMVFDGIEWKTVDCSKEIQYCVLCKKSDWSHNDINLGEPFPDHPFVGNNLELLEWKNEQKEKEDNQRSLSSLP